MERCDAAPGADMGGFTLTVDAYGAAVNRKEIAEQTFCNATLLRDEVAIYSYSGNIQRRRIVTSSG